MTIDQRFGVIAWHSNNSRGSSWRLYQSPLDDAPHLTKALGGPRILIKRDDLTGLALGGNKTRKLEYLMADAMAQGADVVITAGAAQSNHCRQTAAAARKAGMRSILVLTRSEHNELQGNLLLDALLDAHIRMFAARLARVSLQWPPWEKSRRRNAAVAVTVQTWVDGFAGRGMTGR